MLADELFYRCWHHFVTFCMGQYKWCVCVVLVPVHCVIVRTRCFLFIPPVNVNDIHLFVFIHIPLSIWNCDGISLLSSLIVRILQSSIVFSCVRMNPHQVLFANCGQSNAITLWNLILNRIRPTDSTQSNWIALAHSISNSSNSSNNNISIQYRERNNSNMTTENIIPFGEFGRIYLGSMWNI